MAADDYIIRFTDPARSDGELISSTFVIKPFTVNGPQHPIVDTNFTDPETGNATSRQSPIVLYGKGIPEYGEQMGNNLLQVAENFAGSSAPSITTTAGGPLPGVTWFRDEKYWVDTAGQDVFVWNDDTDAWVDVTSTASWSGNAPVFDLAANRSVAFPLPVTGDYFYATDTNELSVFYVWADFTPTITAWLARISRDEAFSPTAELPRRHLSVFDPTVGQEDFIKMLSYKGNDDSDPIPGVIHITSNAAAISALPSSVLTNKDYVDTEIAAAIGGSNALYQLLDVDSNLIATTGNTPPPADGEVLMFSTALAGGGFDGLWTNVALASTNISDFSAAADARIALAIIDDLADVNVTNGPGIDGFALVYNDGASEWQATATAATDTFLEYNNEPGPISPYSVASSTGLLTMTRNDAQIITADNITPQSDYFEHINGPYPATSHVSLLAHDADVIDWTAGALAIGGTPTDVEQAIQLLDAAVVGASGTGYTQFGTLVGDPNATGASTAGDGEAIANLMNFRSGNDRFTIAITNNGGANNDNALFTVNEANIVHDNLSGFVGVEHINHFTTGINTDGLIAGQDETNYDGAPVTEGTFTGGAGYSVADVITLSDGSTVTVDVEAAGVITQFTVTTSSGTTGVASVALTQNSVVPTGGAGFTLTPEADNILVDTGLSSGGNLTATRDLAVDIAGTTVEATVDGVNDLFLMWDNSVSALRAVIGNNLPGGGGGSAYTTITGIGGNASGTATAGVSDTLNLQSNNNILTILVSEPGTDRVEFTINEANLAFGSLIDDTTPELGGDLNVGNQQINATAGNDVLIRPLGTGSTIISDIEIPRSGTLQTVNATITQAIQFFVTADETKMITVRTTGTDTASNESFWSFIRMGVSNHGGANAALVGSFVEDFGTDDGTWGGVSITFTGNFVEVNVQGEATSTIDWVVAIEVS